MGKTVVRSQTVLNFDEALEGFGPDLRRAFDLSHEMLANAGVPHVVVGGIAVNAYGYHYTTRDVDYLVDARDAFDGDVVLVHRPNVPFRVGGVDIDYVTERDSYPSEVREAMRACVAEAREREDKSGIVPDWLLTWMKLSAGRSKDMAAVEGLVRSGLDVEAVRANLPGPDRVRELFERCVAAAESATRGA